MRQTTANCQLPAGAWTGTALHAYGSPCGGRRAASSPHRLAPTVGSRISAAHLPQGRWRTPLYVLFLPLDTTTAGGTPEGTMVLPEALAAAAEASACAE